MALKNMIKEFADYLGDQESVLDRDYSRAARQIELTWGHAEFYRCLEKLQVVEKGWNRAGFPFEVILEFDKLKEIHEHLYPQR